MGFIFGSGKKAAKEQAKATLDSANLQAQSDRYAAQAAEQAQETMLAQKLAGDRAAELLSVPMGQVDVQLATDPAPVAIDPITGRRKTTRSLFTGTGDTNAGIKL